VPASGSVHRSHGLAAAPLVCGTRGIFASWHHRHGVPALASVGVSTSGLHFPIPSTSPCARGLASHKTGAQRPFGPGARGAHTYDAQGEGPVRHAASRQCIETSTSVFPRVPSGAHATDGPDGVAGQVHGVTRLPAADWRGRHL